MRPPNVDQLRHEIDRGRTGDKVDVPDPAAAPLGTDEEAAGTPVPSEAIHLARKTERADLQHPPERLSAVLLFALIIALLVSMALGCALLLKLV